MRWSATSKLQFLLARARDLLRRQREQRPGGPLLRTVRGNETDSRQRARLDAEEPAASDEQGRELRRKAVDAEQAAAAAYRTYVDAKSRSVALDAKASELDPGATGTSPEPDIWRSSSERA